MPVEFSIITPCGYRDRKRILELQQNLSNQTFKNFEWIVACSNPLFNLPKTNFKRYVINPVYNTIGSARNYAINIAEGKYIIFIDADDYIKPDALENLYYLSKRYQGNYVFDLNKYITYEPEKIFIKSIDNKYELNEKLPQWGGKKDTDPNQHMDKIIQQVPKSVREYRKKNKCFEWLYQGKDKYCNLHNQLQCEGKVIPTALVHKYHIKFDDYFPLYSSIPFMLRILHQIKGVVRTDKYYYMMVYHNDPINDPSITEIQSPYKCYLKLRMFYIALNYELADNNKQGILSFTYYILNYLNTYIYKDIVSNRSSIFNNHQLVFDQVRTLITVIENNVLDDKTNYKPLNLIQEGKYKKANKEINKIFDLRMLHKLVNNHGRGITKAMYFKHYLHLPVKQNNIMFESFLGRSFSDNPKYIFKYLYHHSNQQYKFIWVADAKHFDDIKHKLENYDNTKVVKRFGFNYMKALATSKYFVFNMRQPKWFIKRHGMKFLETWHGTPLKHLVFDMANVSSASHKYKAIFYHQSRQWDNLIVDNKFSHNVFSHAFMYPTQKMFNSGYPRNDILSSPNKVRLIKKIKTKLGIPLNKKVILYAPTWRDNHYITHGQYLFKLHLDLGLLQKYLGKDYVLILRTHYFIANHIDTSKYKGFVYNESDYDDIAELYLISNILITDYSSVFFDYANLKRPILFYVYDYDSYASVLRGFYLSMKKDLPGPLLKTSDDVLGAIQHISQIKQLYQNRYQKFYNKFNKWDNGNSSSLVVHSFFK